MQKTVQIKDNLIQVNTFILEEDGLDVVVVPPKVDVVVVIEFRT